MATHVCTGFGDCWESNGENFKYPNVICQHNCQRKDCANAPICGLYQYPEWVADFKHGVCISCSSKFKKALQFSEDECPVCMETKMCVTLPNCSHKECVDCFKRAWYGAEPPPQPEFPIPEIEDAYHNNEEPERYKHHPLIKKWERDMEKWDIERASAWRNEQNLRCCPLCRK